MTPEYIREEIEHQKEWMAKYPSETFETLLWEFVEECKGSSDEHIKYLAKELLEGAR